MNTYQSKKFWEFRNATDEKPPELILYGDIASRSWRGDEITPKQFKDDLESLGDISNLTVHMNSGGGDVFAAVAIYTQLKNHKANITVVVDGWIASAATIIAMAGNEIQIPSAGAFMIHDPAMGVLGYYNESEFAKFAEELSVVKNCIINAYAEKTNKSADEIALLMSKETWYTGEEAVKAGFCDKVLFGKTEAEMPITDYSRYKNIPTTLLNSRAIATVEHINHNKKGVENSMEIKTVDELREAYPDLASQIAETAAATATAAERKRIQDIEGIALAGFEGIIDKAKFESPATAAEVAVSIVAEQKKQGKAYLENRNQDAQDSGTNEVTANGTEGINEKTNPYDAAIDSVFPEKK